MSIVQHVTTFLRQVRNVFWVLYPLIQMFYVYTHIYFYIKLLHVIYIAIPKLLSNNKV